MADSIFNIPLQPTPEAESTASSVASHHDSFQHITPSGHDHITGSDSGISAAPGGSSLAHANAAMPFPQLPGATVYKPTTAPTAELNPRSCVTCRRRKVRCDKLMPCSNCRRAMVPCIFPAPERAPRRPRRKDLNTLKSHQSSERELELLKRLRKLEGIVEELSGQVELETSSTKPAASNSSSPEAVSATDTQPRSSADFGAASGILGPRATQYSPKLAGASPVAGSPGRLVGRNSSLSSLTTQTKDTQRKFGRLMINDSGRSRYVSSAFWSKINDELDELRAETQRLSASESDDSETESTPPQEEDRPTADHHAFVFGFQSTAIDLRPLHPLPSQIPYIWQVYQENVDPVIKVLHIPTTSKLVREARTNLDSLSPASEALMFAIYYTAVGSLEENEIQTNFMTEKSVLLNKYRFALEQALSKANLLTTSDLVTMQAFVLLIVLVFRQEDMRLTWTLSGLAIRISQSIGLHRDGTNFPSLTPFEIEMRRRLFWSLCIIDMRSSEDQGTDLAIQEHGVDTQLPLNINDSDISPESTSFPPAREGLTDMTFALIRYEICRVARRLYNMHMVFTPGECAETIATLEERERLIHEVFDRVDRLYLQHSDPNNNPMFWIAAKVTRVICTKMTLVVYQPVLFLGPENENMSREIRDRLFVACTEMFAYSYTLTTDARAKQLRWLFQTYTMWQAVAYVLIEANHRPWSATIERAWASLNSMVSASKQHDIQTMAGNASLFLPLKFLYNKARKHRNAELARLRRNPEEIARLDQEERSRFKPTMFATYHGDGDEPRSREWWLRLVGAPQLIDRPPDPPRAPSSVGASPQNPAIPIGNVTSVAQPPQPAQSGMQQQQQLPVPPQSINYAGPVEQSAQELSADTLHRIFSEPTFQPTDLMPLINLAKGNINNCPPATFGAFSSADMPRQDDSLAAFVTRQPPVFTDAGSAEPGQPAQPTAQQSEATPLVDAMVKNYPPPWLWSQEPNSIDQFSSVLADDTDMTMDEMDENFDWQDFSQTLGGIPNSVWSHGV